MKTTRTPVGLDQLCEEVVHRQHASVRALIPVVRGALTELTGQLPADDALASVRQAVGELAATADAHLAKEEYILFPALRSLAQAERAGTMRPPLPFPSLAHPIRVMEADHARLDQVRADARAAIGAAAGPPERWAGFVQAFARLDAALESHARYENEVLFPRALELEARMI